FTVRVFPAPRLPLPLKVRPRLPPITALPPTLKLLPSATVVVAVDCNVPPLRFRLPAPAAVLAFPVSVQPVKVVAPVYVLLQDKTNVPAPDMVSAPAPESIPDNVMMPAVLLTVSVLAIRFPAPLRVRLLLPPIVAAPFTV